MDQTTLNMSTYTQILYHIVFGTKFRIQSLERRNRPLLFKYLWGVMRNKKCHLYRINGVEDHIHILTHVHPTVALSDLIKDIKLSSNFFFKEKQLFPTFKGWQEGYAAFTHHIDEKERLIDYIRVQEDHHRKVSWPEELKTLLKEHQIEFDERYLL